MEEKLVRDNIPDVIRKNGGNPAIRVAGDEDYYLPAEYRAACRGDECGVQIINPALSRDKYVLQ